MKNNNSFHTSSIKNLKAENKALRLQLLQEQEKIKILIQKIQTEKNDRIEHKNTLPSSRLDQYQPQVNIQLLQDSIQPVPEFIVDNKNILSQLHKTQEELESQQLNNQNQQKNLKNWRIENQALLLQLQKTQEQLEYQHLNNPSQTVSKLTTDNKDLILQLNKIQEELRHYSDQISLIEIEQDENVVHEKNLLLSQLYKAQEELEDQHATVKNLNTGNQSLFLQLQKTQEQLEYQYLSSHNQTVSKLTADNKDLILQLNQIQEKIQTQYLVDENHTAIPQNFGKEEYLLSLLEQTQSELKETQLELLRLERKQNFSDLSINNLSSGDELYKSLAEIQRLQAIVATQATIHQLEIRSSLQAQLGSILIKGIDSPKGWLSTPGQLLNLWRNYKNKQPPAKLGGKNFDKIIQAYEQNGFPEVENLLQGIVTPAIIGNAYTALARHLITQGNKTQATDAARRAYNADPQSYRLKWLAFRLHESNAILEAEAMLDVLPKGTSFSESESRQASQIRYTAFRIRLNNARKNH
ncbi:hypothetical protein SAMN05192560_0015 [Methylobacillus rhizosphaerae]|uniref:Uncharacterized protein n=1 Tax=Methylobacillus rhizosphaerae TaxID=551994 RepID=A0A238XL02_9PROT|nr:hypothetical protein [Methylobacillus rhizosphaerae]SNR59675.1 hypothetical protein SAMN05192560_0015 [Methylobacillus rhizosphaerae]